MAQKKHFIHSHPIQNNLQKLNKNDPSWFRKVEWCSLGIFFILFLINFYKIISLATHLWFLIIPSILCSCLVADFVCGFVHWLADTWGSVDLPIIGATLIRPFREHHIDQLAMTKHDFVETNAATALLGIPILVGCLFIPYGVKSYFTSFLFCFSFFLTLFGLFTNQIHKFAHTKKAPKVIRFLQNYSLILNPKHHQIHHTSPFNKHYCITNGWLNPLLYKINFFPSCEKLITKYTGALPRRDDIGEQAAKELLQNYDKSS